MQWQEVRQRHPNAWLIVEALQAHSEKQRRILDRLAVLELPADGADAFERYREWHRSHPGRELYFVHTSNAELVIDERTWVGLRFGDEARTAQ